MRARLPDPGARSRLKCPRKARGARAARVASSVGGDLLAEHALGRARRGRPGRAGGHGLLEAGQLDALVEAELLEVVGAALAVVELGVVLRDGQVRVVLGGLRAREAGEEAQQERGEGERA